MAKENEILLNRSDVKKIRESKRLSYDIAEMVMDARIKRKITQTQLARKVGTKQPSIARIERGEYLPSLRFLDKIAQALDTKLVAPRFEFCIENVEFEYSNVNVGKVEEKRLMPRMTSAFFGSYSCQSVDSEVEEDKFNFSKSLSFAGRF